MKLLSPLAALWAAAALFLLACDRGGGFSSIRNLNASGETIVAFGDSLTEGVGAEPGEDYPAVLARLLRRPVVNAGRRGDTAGDGLVRIDATLDLRPRLTIVLFGGNDFLRKVPIEETKRNLDQIVARIQDQGAMVVLVGLRLGLLTDEYSDVYAEIADRRGALYIPRVLAGILSDPKLKSDAIHPNGAGYRLVAERIYKRIDPLLREADRKRG
jgi:lysophospholipase L1-like esterase